MCFDLDSSPPIPVIAGAAVSHEDLVLEAHDGNRFAAFAAQPEEPAEVGIVVLPDVRGLYRFYEELALRFAERGYAAIAIDYFGRTAGISKRDDDFDYMEHVAQLTFEGTQADVGAAVDSPARRGRELDLHGRLLPGRPQLVALGGRRARHRGRRRVLRRPRRAERPARPDAARRRDRRSDPRASGRGRQEHHARAERGVRRGADRGGRRSRDRGLRRRAAQLLRPQARGVRGGVRGRLETRARVRRALLVRAEAASP